jgi:hypothetical protein
MPVIEIGIRACWMNRNCSSKMDGSSWSKPTIMPAITSMPAAWMRWTAVTMSSRVFCVFFVSARLATRGDSMPTKIVVKWACVMRRRSSSSWATLRLTSVMNSMGYPRAACQVASAPSSALASLLLPMKLSSTTKMLATPSAWMASTSASTWATDFVRGRRPYMTMMSQNSQLNGQPRAN